MVDILQEPGLVYSFLSCATVFCRPVDITRSQCGGTARTGLASAGSLRCGSTRHLVGSRAVSKTLWLRTWGGADGPCQVVVDRSACPGRTDQSASLPLPAWSSLPVHSPAPPRMQRSSPRMLLNSTRRWEAAIFRSLLRPLLTPSALPLAATRHAQCPARLWEFRTGRASPQPCSESLRETSLTGNAVMWHRNSCRTRSGLRQAERNTPRYWFPVSRTSRDAAVRGGW